MSGLLLTAGLWSLAACGGSGSDSGGVSATAANSASSTTRGSVISNMQLASYEPAELLNLLGASTLGQELETLNFTPVCSVSVYQVDYDTVGGKGEATTDSAAVMIPSGDGAGCSGARPIVLYAHGTNPAKDFNIAELSNSDDDEGVLLAVVFASQGYIVVAPNYAGYDDSTLPYHPYLVATQQSDDMIDALAAARSVLPEAGVPAVSASAALFITGYSQGGYVAMATHRAMQAAGMSVTASGPMSGPYALAAFGDAVFEGEVDLSATENITLLSSSYQNTYGNLYSSSPAELFASPYDDDVIGLLPSSTPLVTLYADNELPQNALFSSTAPAAQYDSMTPATAPAELAPAFAMGFGTPFLITDSYRLAYLQDAQTNPDGGFPSLTNGLPAASPGNTLRQDLKTNDLRNWSPAAPVLLCGGDEDPDVFFLNLQLMQHYWGAHPGSATPVYVDLESSGSPYSTEKQEFAIAKAAVLAQGGSMAVLADYHATLVPPFCLSIVKSFFDGYVN
ncbi:MAG TPA: hypothetical protein VME21_07575 [Steroidobacteraceae bacterium]|nr:hypothetical protein [Steroidobacteraceae bacterium]